MASRFYFYTLEGKAIETKISNKNFASCGASIAENKNGKWYKKYYDTKKGKLFARTEMEVFINHKLDKQEITIKDFPEQKAIMVKHWAPNPDCIEWFILTDIQENEKHANSVDLADY